MASSRSRSQVVVMLMMLQLLTCLCADVRPKEACSNDVKGGSCKNSGNTASFKEFDDETRFLQIGFSEGPSGNGGQALRSEDYLASPSARSTCAELVNRGSFFSVDIEVGTPGQTFSVVADTGSNSLIVPSCVCKQQYFSACSRKDRCYTGTNKSSSYELITVGDGKVAQFAVSFGSGTITAVPAKEVVKVGDTTVNMTEGILLMTSNMLKISGPFEGILGLGLPNSTEEMKAEEERRREEATKARKNSSTPKEDLIKKIMKKIFGGYEKDVVGKGEEQSSTESSILGSTRRQLPFNWPWSYHHEDKKKEIKPLVLGHPPGFLEQGHIERFSMCFNEETSGSLRFGGDAAAKPISNLGKFHWGLGLAGMSVGNQKSKLSFCVNKTDDQETACGFIPDSGTTFIMGPKDQLSEMFGSICDNWDRCVKNHTAMVEAADAAKEAAIEAYGVDPFKIKPYSKTEVLALLLLDCQSWLTESDGLNEMPSLNFHVEGGDGEQQTLELPGWAYILESTSVDVNETYKNLQSLLQEGILKNASKHEKVCSPAFGAMNYDTLLNGPVWILGTPLFYQYNVGYDLITKPPSMSFTSLDDTPCTPCKESASLLSQSREQSARSDRRYPRWVSGPMRVPDYDVLQPL